MGRDVPTCLGAPARVGLKKGRITVSLEKWLLRRVVRPLTCGFSVWFEYDHWRDDPDINQDWKESVQLITSRRHQALVMWLGDNKSEWFGLEVEAALLAGQAFLAAKCVGEYEPTKSDLEADEVLNEAGRRALSAMEYRLSPLIDYLNVIESRLESIVEPHLYPMPPGCHDTAGFRVTNIDRMKKSPLAPLARSLSHFAKRIVDFVTKSSARRHDAAIAASSDTTQEMHRIKLELEQALVELDVGLNGLAQRLRLPEDEAGKIETSLRTLIRLPDIEHDAWYRHSEAVRAWAEYLLTVSVRDTSSPLYLSPPTPSHSTIVPKESIFANVIYALREWADDVEKVRSFAIFEDDDYGPADFGFTLRSGLESAKWISAVAQYEAVFTPEHARRLRDQLNALMRDADELPDRAETYSAQHTAYYKEIEAKCREVTGCDEYALGRAIFRRNEGEVVMLHSPEWQPSTVEEFAQLSHEDFMSRLRELRRDAYSLGKRARTLSNEMEAVDELIEGQQPVEAKEASPPPLKTPELGEKERLAYESYKYVKQRKEKPGSLRQIHAYLQREGFIDDDGVEYDVPSYAAWERALRRAREKQQEIAIAMQPNADT